jgi:hypothetical protein
MAMANAKISRPQPWLELSGCKKRPKLCRVPSESIRIRQAHASTTAGVRQDDLNIMQFLSMGKAW